MHLFDLINGLFEMFGFIAVGMSCLRTYKDKQVRGVSISMVLFFTSWGFYNLLFYPHLYQWLSTIGAGFTCAANTTWLVLIIKYRKN